jgi:hypothetical protein
MASAARRQTWAFGHPGRERLGGPAGPSGEADSGDPDGQRKSRAGGEQRCGGVRLGVQPARSDDLGEQGAGLGVIEHVEVDEAAAGQAGQQVAAGDEHPAGHAARHERARLGGRLSTWAASSWHWPPLAKPPEPDYTSNSKGRRLAGTTVPGSVTERIP